MELLCKAGALGSAAVMAQLFSHHPRGSGLSDKLSGLSRQWGSSAEG